SPISTQPAASTTETASTRPIILQPMTSPPRTGRARRAGRGRRARGAPDGHGAGPRSRPPQAGGLGEPSTGTRYHTLPRRPEHNPKGTRISAQTRPFSGRLPGREKGAGHGVVEGVAGSGGGDVGLDGAAGEGQIADEVEEFVAGGFGVE